MSGIKKLSRNYIDKFRRLISAIASSYAEMKKLFRKQSIQSLLKWFSLLFLIEGIVTFIFLSRISSDPQNAVFLGFSLSRIYLLAFLSLVNLLFLWIFVNFLLASSFSKKVVLFFESIVRRERILWISISGMTVGLVLCVFLLSQWKFTATDLQIRAYFQSLTPLLILILFIFVQFLIMLMVISDPGRSGWLRFLKVITLGYCLFMFLFVAEFYVLNAAIPRYFIEETYGSAFREILPYILAQWVLIAQWILGSGSSLQSKTKFIVYLSLMLVVAIFYYRGAAHHALSVNTDITRSDQKDFVNFTQQVVNSDFRYMGNRNQTPAYPFIQALFCNDDLEDDVVFSCGKQVNILLSLVMLTLIFGLIFPYLGFIASVSFTLVTAFSLFIFKAGYFKVDLVYYFASFLAFILMAKILITPTYRLGLITGLSLGFTQLLKASALPAMVLLIIVFLVKETITVFSSAPSKGLRSLWEKINWGNMVSLFFVIIGFIAIQFPYLRENKKLYDNYFYNVNTAVYIWFDSFEEATLAHESYQKTNIWPGFAQDEEPGLHHFLKNHTYEEMFSRFWEGLQNQIYYLMHSYSLFNYVILYFSVLLGLAVIQYQSVKLIFQRFLPQIVFVVFYVTGYLCLNAWYAPVGPGPRFFYSLYLPILFSVLVAIRSLSNHDIRIGDWKIGTASIITWINYLIIALAIYDAAWVIIKILPQGYFGS